VDTGLKADYYRDTSMQSMPKSENEPVGNRGRE
jgi:hypothetical protein